MNRCIGSHLALWSPRAERLPCWQPGVHGSSNPRNARTQASSRLRLSGSTLILGCRNGHFAEFVANLTLTVCSRTCSLTNTSTTSAAAGMQIASCLGEHRSTRRLPPIPHSVLRDFRNHDVPKDAHWHIFRTFPYSISNTSLGFQVLAVTWSCHLREKTFLR